MATEPAQKKPKTSTGNGRLANKVILITAAAQGIGRASAIACANEGATVIATDINEKLLRELNEHEGITTEVLNVTNKEAVEDTLRKHPNINVLFNCAGFVHHGTILDCQEKDFDFSFNLNVKSMFLLCQTIIPQMKALGGGSIINMASVVSGIKGAPNRFVYGASKAAVIGLTKSIAVDFISDGIRCNAICPGTIETPSLHDRMAASGDKEKALQGFIARQKMGRLGQPEEVAAIVVYLASDESSFVTGTETVIDGGWSV